MPSCIISACIVGGPTPSEASLCAVDDAIAEMIRGGFSIVQMSCAHGVKVIVESDDALEVEGNVILQKFRAIVDVIQDRLQRKSFVICMAPVGSICTALDEERAPRPHSGEPASDWMQPPTTGYRH